MSPVPLQLTLFGASSPTARKALESAAPPVVPDSETLRRQANELAHFLSAELKVPVRLSVTDNRSTMVSFRRGPTALILRVHHMFLEAPLPVRQAMALYAGRGQKASGQVLDEYIRAQTVRIRRGASETVPLQAVGRHFDLKAIFDALNRAHFEGQIQAAIGWGRGTGKRRRRSIRLGVYDHQSREIRIHPALDRPHVPAYFVEFIVFHEMLHQLFPSLGPSSRKVHHPRAFRAREKTFPHYEAALRWEQENIKRLLTA